MSGSNGHPAVKEAPSTEPATALPAEETKATGTAVYQNAQAFSIVAEQNASIAQSGAAIVIVGENLELKQAGAGVLIVGENVHISQGGCGFLMAGGDVTVTDGDPALVQSARGTLRSSQSSLLLAARDAHIQNASVGVVLARNATLDEHTHVTLNVSFYELAGAIVGLTFLLPVRLMQRLGAKGKSPAA